MKIPYGWIREFVDLDLTAEQARERLVNAGVEVASLTPVGPDLRGVVVGTIEAIEQELGESHGHRLLLCRVGTGRQRFSVVCGAPNTAAGVRAAFAPPGAVLPGGRRIETTRIHGVSSEGMLCSERELSLGEEHEAGLMLLEPEAAPGTDLRAHLGLDDVVLDVEITPNRADCLSVMGVARELAALTGAPLRVPPTELPEEGEPVETLARVRIAAPGLCHRFTARVISDVRVGPSPARLRMRLRAAGLRPISNAVDITNYVMWETGQPLHAFDHATVTDATIVVRQAGAGERFTTLDGQERVLDASMLVIADPRRAIGLAGVMGGAETEVTAATTRILLEAAWFLPASIRRTSRTLGIPSDAAYRFERGIDLQAVAAASARAAQLMARLTGGRVAPGVVDVYPRPWRPRRLRLRMERVQRVLGVAPPRTTARDILQGLGFTATERGRGLAVEVPSFRRDVAIEDDLVEEVIRVWGYDRIPATPSSAAVGMVRQPASVEQTRVVRRALAGAGLSEAITYSFGDPALDVTLGGTQGAVTLLNPLSQEASRLRRHPLEGVLEAVATNLRRQQTDVGVFELCRTYAFADGVPREARWVALAVTGARGGDVWAGRGEVDVYDVKGLTEHVLGALGVHGWEVRQVGAAWLEADCAGAFVGPVPGAVSGETPSGEAPRGGSSDTTADRPSPVPVEAPFGEVARAVRERFGIRQPVFAAWVPLDDVARVEVPAIQYQALPRFPAVQRDLAFLLGAAREVSVTAGDVEAAIRAEAGPLLRDVQLFDIHQFSTGGGDGTGGGRSLAWRLTFQAADRTLTDDEVNAIHARVARSVTEQFHITWRGV